MRALIVEDDPAVANFIRQGLKENAFQVDHAADGSDGLALSLGQQYDIIVLDLMLPGVDGFEIISRVRRMNLTTPIICLTARDALDDRIRGLDLGADDYLAKPFSFAELIARIRALLRRGNLLAGNPLQVADLSVDLIARHVSRGGRRIDLSAKEFDLLEFLVRNVNQVVSRSMILSSVWGTQHDPQTNVVDVHINRLRKKVDHGHATALIHTTRGVGYVLREP